MPLWNGDKAIFKMFLQWTKMHRIQLMLSLVNFANRELNLLAKLPFRWLKSSNNLSLISAGFKSLRGSSRSPRAGMVTSLHIMVRAAPCPPGVTASPPVPPTPGASTPPTPSCRCQSPCPAPWWCSPMVRGASTGARTTSTSTTTPSAGVRGHRPCTPGACGIHLTGAPGRWRATRRPRSRCTRPGLFITPEARTRTTRPRYSLGMEAGEAGAECQPLSVISLWFVKLSQKIVITLPQWPASLGMF